MKTFIIVLGILVGAIVAGYYAMPDAEFTVAEPDVDDTMDAMITDGMPDEAVPLEDGSYVLVSEDSSMQWQGSRPLISGYFDNGNITIAHGRAVVADGTVEAGEVTIDMTSIAAESTGRGSGESMLTNHLKSADWFDAETYPESRFVFTSAEENDDGTVLVTGELTIKDITNALTFPAVVTMRDDALVIRANEIEIDRTLWDIQYQSGSFFSDLGERLIDDIFTLTFTAVFESAAETEAETGSE